MVKPNYMNCRFIDKDGNYTQCVVCNEKYCPKYRAIDRKNPIKPDYYNDTKIAPIDVIEDRDLDFCLGSALKYIKRAGKKENNPSVQDLKKVIWYIERRIKELEEIK